MMTVQMIVSIQWLASIMGIAHITKQQAAFQQSNVESRRFNARVSMIFSDLLSKIHQTEI